MNSKKFADKTMFFLEKYNDYSDKDRIIAHYGLETLYILVTKTIIVIIVSLFFNITKEMLIFILLYSILRFYAGGIHLSSSIGCTILSTIVLLFFPIMCKNIIITMPYKLIIDGLSIYLVAMYSPADTVKKPIINDKHRNKLRLTSYLFYLIWLIFSIFIKNNFYSNLFTLSMLLEGVLISPCMYKLFKQPYNNYLIYGNTKRKEE